MSVEQLKQVIIQLTSEYNNLQEKFQKQKLNSEETIEKLNSEIEKLKENYFNNVRNYAIQVFFFSMGLKYNNSQT